MKKILLVILGIILAFLLFTLPAYAVDVLPDQQEALDTESVEEAVPASAYMMEDMGVMDALDTDSWISGLISKAKDELTGFLKTGLKNAGAMFAVAVLCSVAETVRLEKPAGTDYVSLAGVLSIAAISAVSMTSFMSMASSAIDDMNTFSKAILPTLAAAAASGGAVTSAPAKLAICVLFMDISITVSMNVVIPLIYAYFALATTGCALDSGISGIASAVKKLIVFILTVMSLAFTAYLSLSGVVADSADAVTTKAAKTVISTVLPVVGGMISDAASTVLSGVSVIRNAVGIFGVCVVCAICLVPFLKLGANYILFKISAVFSGCVSNGGVSKMIDSTASVYSLCMGLVGVDAMMLFFSLISLIKAVGV